MFFKMRETSEDTHQLSDADFEQYDRQIRLWGVAAQRRLKSARVLTIGLGGYGAEVVKNIVLMGIGNVTLMDHETITLVNGQLNGQLLITLPVCHGTNRALASLKRAQELNPKVVVKAIAVDIREDFSMVKDYDVVFLSTGSHNVKIDVNNACRKHGVKFMCGSDHGFYTAGFLDLGVHHYQIPEGEKKEKKEEKPEERTEIVEEVEAISFLGDEDDLTDLGAEVEIAPDSDDELVSDDEIVEIIEASSEDKSGNNNEGGNGDNNGSTFLVENYCTYEEAVIGCDWTKRTKKEMRQSSAAYFVMRVVERFFDNYNAYPKHNRDDYLALRKYKFEIMKECNINNGCLTEDFYQHCIGSLSPVVAISAGVVAQEMLKAITRQGKPHCNFFFFDGQKKTGIVDYIGPR